MNADWRSRNSRDPSELETLAKSISTSLPEEGNSQSRFVCIMAVSSTTTVLCLETRLFQSGDRCPTTDLGQSIPLCIPPILPYSTSLEESKLRPNRKNVACHTNLAVSNLPPPLLEISIIRPLLLTRSARLINPQGEVHLRSSSSNFKQKITTSGVDHIRERLLKKGVSETATQQVQDGKHHSQIKNRPG